jgi:outer membrane lipoprotein-sorting protein
MKKALAIIFTVVIIMMTLAGCTQADRVSKNLSKQADSFNVARKLTVINVRTDTILFQITGNFSVEKEDDGDLAVIGENDDGTYYKHFVCLADEITYIVEDLGVTKVNKYRYEINFNPKMIIPVEPVVID